MIKSILLRWLWTLIEYLMIFPVILIATALLIPKGFVELFTFTLPIHILAAIILTSSLKKFKYILLAVIGAVYVGILSTVLLLASSGTLVNMIGFIICIGLSFIWGIKKGIGSSNSLVFFYTGGIAIYAISLFFLNRVEVLSPYFNLAVITFLVYAVFALPLANRFFLISESKLKNSLDKMPSSVARGNAIIVAALLVAIGIFSVAEYLVKAVEILTNIVVSGIRAIIDYVAFEEVPLDQVPTTEGVDILAEIPQFERNPVLGIIADIISIVIVVLLLSVAIGLIIKYRKQIIKGIMSFFSSLSNRFNVWKATESSYTDEREFLLQVPGTKKTSLKRRLFKREKRWRDMKDNTSRTRFLYTKFVLNSIKKGFVFNTSNTPSETVSRISEEVKKGGEDHRLIDETYNTVRYGQLEPSDDTIKILKDRYL